MLRGVRGAVWVGLALALGATFASRAVRADEPDAGETPSAQAPSAQAESASTAPPPSAAVTSPPSVSAPSVPAAAAKPAQKPPSDEIVHKKKVGRTSNAHADKGAFHHGTGHDEETEEGTHPAVLPVLGGSSDIGFMFGLAGAVSHVKPGYYPHQWFASGLVSLSVRDGEIVQQAARLRVDLPDFLDTDWRFGPGFTYDRTINRPYFGIGNRAPVDIDPVTGTLPVGNKYRYATRDFSARLFAEYDFDGPWEVALGLQVRYTNPEPYEGSQLDLDAKGLAKGKYAPILGVNHHIAFVPQLGLVYDTRDDETMPETGAYHLFGARVSVAVPTSTEVRSFAFDTTFRKYFHLGGPFVFAVRFLGDYIVGNAAYYDYITGGSFGTFDLLGGALGVRGVPAGRFGGLVKVAGNSELRFMYPWTKVLGQKFRIGHALFFDAGRSFVSLGKADPRDGELWRLHWGTGGALYVQLNEALFRAELAYSPDAAQVSPSFPFGFYLMDGVMF